MSLSEISRRHVCLSSENVFLVEYLRVGIILYSVYTSKYCSTTLLSVVYVYALDRAIHLRAQQMFKAVENCRRKVHIYTFNHFIA